MNIDREILKKEQLRLPIEYTDNDLVNAIATRLRDFHNLLVSDKKTSVISRERIDYLIKMIQTMYDEYYLGHHSKAYDYFKKALVYNTRGELITSTISDEPLYRARINDSTADFNNDEMFHIKNRDRGKVKTQRFSFPGLPCLYLGTSSYVCWQELDRPAFDKFQVALFGVKDKGKSAKVLDLCIHPYSFYKELERCDNGQQTEHQDLDLEQYLIWWPIMAACSVMVEHPNDPFKPEYVFPQFMLEYVLEEQPELIGIKYFSNKAGRTS
jgi:hypothetical protein